MHNSLPDETTLPNGQKFDLLALGLLGVPSLADHFSEITAKLQDLKFDLSDYICVKFLLLLNPGERRAIYHTPSPLPFARGRSVSFFFFFY
jgi:nuclear receptor subfamily 5 group A protein 3